MELSVLKRLVLMPESYLFSNSILSEISCEDGRLMELAQDGVH
jgi:hypothetical protein